MGSIDKFQPSQKIEPATKEIASTPKARQQSEMDFSIGKILGSGDCKDVPIDEGSVTNCNDGFVATFNNGAKTAIDRSTKHQFTKFPNGNILEKNIDE